MSDQEKTYVPEDLWRMAAQIVQMEAACIEWGATAERSIELVVEQLMILRTAEQAFAAERIALLESKLADAERRERGMREAASPLLDAMETCHICKGLILLEETPTHCENCSFDCESHDEPECTPIYELHRRLRAALAQQRGEDGKR